MSSLASHDSTESIKLLLLQREYERAIAACRDALNQRESQSVRLMMGKALVALRRFEEARSVLVPLEDQQPNLAELQRVLGETWLRSGHPEAAERALRRAIALDPTDSAAHELLRDLDSDDSAAAPTARRWLGEGPTVEQNVLGLSPDRSPLTQELSLDMLDDEESFGDQTSLSFPHALSIPPPPPSVKSSSPVANPAKTVESSSNIPTSRIELEPTTNNLSSRRGFEDDDLTQLAARAFDGSEPPSSGATKLRNPTLMGLPTIANPALMPAKEAWPDLPRPSSFPTERGHASPSIPPARAVIHHQPATDASSEGPSWAPPPPLETQSSPGAYASPSAPSSAGRSSSPIALSSSAGRISSPGSISFPGTPGSESITPSPVRSSDEVPSPIPRGVGWIPGSTDAGWAKPESNPSPWPHPENDLGPMHTSATHDALGSTARSGRPARRSRGALWVGAAALGLLACLGLLALGYRVMSERSGSSSLRAAELAANADGRLVSLERALSRIEPSDTAGPEARALRARLLSVMTLEHGIDRSVEVEGLLSDTAVAALPNGKIARSLLLVYQGRDSEALGALSGLVAQGEELAEAYRARALAAYYAGRIPDAEDAAREALHIHPGTPRYAALEAWLRYRAGDAASAIAVLDTAIDAAISPAIRVARARIALANEDNAVALVETDAVLGPLAGQATPLELGWSYLVRAHSKRALGRDDFATDVSEAMQRVPRFDTEYRVGLAEVLLATGSAAEARSVLEATPVGLIERSRFAALLAEAALEMSDFAGAEAALRDSGPGADAVMLRARLSEAQGEVDSAVERYLQAAADPRFDRVARMRAARVLRNANRPGEAAMVLARLLDGSSVDVDTLSLYSRLALDAGEVRQALEVVARAIELEPARSELYAIRAAAALSLGETARARGDVERALSADQLDGALMARLGSAALDQGELETARAVVARLGSSEPSNAELAALDAEIALHQARHTDAEAQIMTLPEGLVRARLEARLRVARGEGASAVDRVSELSRTYAAPELWVSLAQLLEQAESDSSAESMYQRALRIDSRQIGAILGLASLEIRGGGLAAASRGIEQAAELARQTGASASIRARIESTAGRLAFERGDFDGARRSAQRALELDPRCAEAHALLASIAIERDQDPGEALRAAAAGNGPLPEAIAQLALRSTGPDRCELAHRYLSAAPRGYDRTQIEHIARGCPRAR